MRKTLTCEVKLEGFQSGTESGTRNSSWHSGRRDKVPCQLKSKRRIKTLFCEENMCPLFLYSNWVFPQLHKVGNVRIIANFVLNSLQFSSLFAPTDINKLEIRNQGVCEDCISRSHALLDQLIFNVAILLLESICEKLEWKLLIVICCFCGVSSCGLGPLQDFRTMFCCPLGTALLRMIFFTAHSILGCLPEFFPNGSFCLHGFSEIPHDTILRLFLAKVNEPSKQGGVAIFIHFSRHKAL